jgi:hypothetical protein
MYHVITDFNYLSTSASHLGNTAIMGFLCQLFERFLRVDVHGRTNVASARATWRSMITVLPKWESLCLLQGRSCSGGLLQNTSCVLPFGPSKNR